MSANNLEVSKEENPLVAPVCPQLCAYCQQAVGMIKQSGMVMTIKQYVRSLCVYCPSRDQCESTIDQVAHDIETKTPEQVCKMVGLCDSKPKMNALFRN